MKVAKKISKSGAITLPKALRSETGLFPGNAVDIESNKDGSLTIKPLVPCCRFCGTVENVLRADENIFICRNCAKTILARVDVTDE